MLYLERPFLGSRQMVLALRDFACHVNRKRAQRLMRLMGLEGGITSLLSMFIETVHIN